MQGFYQVSIRGLPSRFVLSWAQPMHSPEWLPAAPTSGSQRSLGQFQGSYVVSVCPASIAHLKVPIPHRNHAMSFEDPKDDFDISFEIAKFKLGTHISFVRTGLIRYKNSSFLKILHLPTFIPCVSITKIEQPIAWDFCSSHT